MTDKKRHNYKNLKIWQLGLEISFQVSDLIVKFPKHEKYDLSSQISRCSVSMPSNIAEGSAGSSSELITQLYIANHRKYIDKTALETLLNKITEFQKMTMGFQNGL